ncbi:hypothetical protein HF086_009999 [Spodoptera exigua]|uniref:Uncharacterized protein n=1 Tax=Spodoptera exigua TaxID=7107 RepID=A0A922MS03_SPOEX|nr:hypothetical protein HF086_009999 [Spodoptera exigua]
MMISPPAGALQLPSFTSVSADSTTSATTTTTVAFIDYTRGRIDSDFLSKTGRTLSKNNSRRTKGFGFASLLNSKKPKSSCSLSMTLSTPTLPSQCGCTTCRSAVASIMVTTTATPADSAAVATTTTTASADSIGGRISVDFLARQDNCKVFNVIDVIDQHQKKNRGESSIRYIASIPKTTLGQITFLIVSLTDLQYPGHNGTEEDQARPESQSREKD